MNEQLYKLINFNEKINIVDIGASPLLDNVNKQKKKGEPEFSSYQNLMRSDCSNKHGICKRLQIFREIKRYRNQKNMHRCSLLL